MITIVLFSSLLGGNITITKKNRYRFAGYSRRTDQTVLLCFPCFLLHKILLPRRQQRTAPPSGRYRHVYTLPSLVLNGAAIWKRKQLSRQVFFHKMTKCQAISGGNLHWNYCKFVGKYSKRIALQMGASRFEQCSIDLWICNSYSCILSLKSLFLSEYWGKDRW